MNPPRFALALLNRFVPDDEPLAGDLIEEFAAGRSRAWFWRQVVVAVAVTAFRRSDEVRPLRLVDGTPAGIATPSTATAAPRRPVNLTASPVAGIGGLGMLAIVVFVTIMTPQSWWLVAAALAAAGGFGALLGMALIAIRRNRV